MKINSLVHAFLLSVATNVTAQPLVQDEAILDIPVRLLGCSSDDYKVSIEFLSELRLARDESGDKLGKIAQIAGDNVEVLGMSFGAAVHGKSINEIMKFPMSENVGDNDRLFKFITKVIPFVRLGFKSDIKSIDPEAHIINNFSYEGMKSSLTPSEDCYSHPSYKGKEGLSM